MNEVSGDSRSNGIEESFILFSQYLGIHCIYLLKSEEAEVGGKLKGPSVVDMSVMMMVMMVLLESCMLMCHFDESLLVRGERVRSLMMVMAFLGFVLCLS